MSARVTYEAAGDVRGRCGHRHRAIGADALRKARDRYGLTVAVHDTLAPALRDAVLEATEELTTRKIEALARRVYLSLGGGE